MKLLLSILIGFCLTSCQQDLSVWFGNTMQIESPDSQIFALDRLSANAGDTVTVSGMNLTDGMIVRIGENDITLNKLSAGLATFVVPDVGSSDLIRARFYTAENKSISTFTLVHSADGSGLPVIDADTALICSDIRYKVSKGDEKTGSRNCSKSYSPCTADGDKFCITSSSFPAANVLGLQFKQTEFKSSLSIAGVRGKLENCAIDGAKGCIIKSPNYAAALLAGAENKIMFGESLAGATGTLTSTLPACATDNGTNCVAVADYPSIIKANLTAADIKDGVTIAGTLGQYPSATYPLASALSTTELTNFSNQMKDDAIFQYFDSRGVRYQASGDSDFLNYNMRLNTNFENLSLSGIMPSSIIRAPGPLTSTFTSSPSDRINLAWQKVGASGYLVIRKNSSPVDWIPTNGVAYNTGPQAGVEIVYVGSSVSFADTNIFTTNSYHYAVYSYDANHYYSSVPVRTSETLNICAGATAGGIWIPVPGDLIQGTRDFCVMKYHAKDVAGVPTSQAVFAPWTNISHNDASGRCPSLGAKYDLLSNEEHLTVSVNLASNPVNWSGGEIGKGQLNMGHTDDNPNFSCASSSDDSLAYVSGSDCTPKSSSGQAWNQKRTHTLQSGFVVWDWGGNAFQLTSTVANWGQLPYVSTDGGPVDAVREITAVDSNFTSTPRLSIAPMHSQYDFWNDAWNSTQRIGSYLAGNIYSGGIVSRGSAWGEQQTGGIFNYDTRQNRSTYQGYVGFRCVYRP